MHEVPWTQDDAKADEAFYFFGEHGAELEPLLRQYSLPRYTTPLMAVRSNASATGLCVLFAP